MSLTVTSLDDIPADIVEQMFAEAKQLMQEKHPEQALQRGPFSDLVLYFRSVFAAGHQVNYDRLRQSMSLRRIELDPTLADTDVVDDVLSNHLVARQAASQASGQIAIVVSQDAPLVISAGLGFTAGSLEFTVDTAIVVRNSTGTAVTDNERVLASRGDGTYEFSVPATAVAAGELSNIKRGTRMTPAARPENFVASRAAADFSGGLAAETNQEMTDRLQEGQAAKTNGGSINWIALFKSQAEFANTRHYSIRGFGDAEQIRDQHTIWPGSLGGRVDVFCRTQAQPKTVTLRLTASLVDIVADGGIWQVTLTADAAPGFYEASRIVRTDASIDETGYEIVADIRGRDLTDTVFVPDIINDLEAAYTKYQTAVIRFRDTDTDTLTAVVGDTAEYIVELSTMPLITELQDFCNSEDHRARACDTVVRAAVPCWVSISFEIRKQSGQATPDTTGMAEDIASLVNNLNFGSRLYASALADIAHNYLSDGQAVGKIDMFGRIRRPDGEMLFVHDTTCLSIPTDPALMLSRDTAVFFLDPANVAISVVSD